MSVVDGSEASIDKVDGDEKEAAASAIPNNNSEPDERKARMALMVAKLQDADHQSMVDYAEEVGSRLDNAITNKSEWEQTDDRGVPSEKKIRDVELRTATDEIENAKKMHWKARGDYAETCPPSQATTSYAPVVADKRRKKKPSIESVAFDYMRNEYQSAQFQSAAKFHKHLIRTAGLDKSPFEMGTGTNARKLFCPAAGSFYDVGTLSNIWSKIRDS